MKTNEFARTPAIFDVKIAIPNVTLIEAALDFVGLDIAR
jgi:ABC-type dipeptide/oligopeptide/nickel transport system permease subunit